MKCLIITDIKYKHEERNTIVGGGGFLTQQTSPTYYSPYHEVEMFPDGQTADEQVLLVHEPRQVVHVNPKRSTVNSDIANNNRSSW